MVRGTLILTRKDIAGLLTFEDYVDACRKAFRAHALGLVVEPALMHLDTESGEFHIKGGGIRGERTFVAVKVNGGFFQNPARHACPPSRGASCCAMATTVARWRTWIRSRSP